MYKRKVLNNYGGAYIKKLIVEEYNMFEDIKQIFSKVINRAMVVCENSGHTIAYDFAEVSKIVEAAATNKPVKDYELTRYACYLIVQNW